jgi:hypothetical protein
MKPPCIARFWLSMELSANATRITEAAWQPLWFMEANRAALAPIDRPVRATVSQVDIHAICPLGKNPVLGRAW